MSQSLRCGYLQKAPQMVDQLFTKCLFFFFFQELSAVLDDHVPEVQNVGQKGENLLQQVHGSSPDHAVVTGKVADVSQKFQELQQKLKAQEEALASKIKDTDEFNTKVDELDTCIQDAREKLAGVGPVSTDPTVVEKQLQLARVSNRFQE